MRSKLMIKFPVICAFIIKQVYLENENTFKLSQTKLIKCDKLSNRIYINEFKKIDLRGNVFCIDKFPKVNFVSWG